MDKALVAGVLNSIFVSALPRLTEAGKTSFCTGTWESFSSQELKCPFFIDRKSIIKEMRSIQIHFGEFRPKEFQGVIMLSHEGKTVTLDTNRLFREKKICGYSDYGNSPAFQSFLSIDPLAHFEGDQWNGQWELTVISHDPVEMLSVRKISLDAVIS